MSKIHHEKPDHTVRLWKRLLIGVYLVFTLFIVAWTTASLVVANFGEPTVKLKGPRIKASADDPKELRKCIKNLQRLLDDFEKESLTLQGRALKYDMNPDAEWSNWSERWKMRGNKLSYRCRLDELSGAEVNPAIDKMAEVHLALGDLHNSSTSVVKGYMGQYVKRLRTLRKKMSAVRTMVDQQHPKKRRP